MSAGQTSPFSQRAVPLNTETGGDIAPNPFESLGPFACSAGRSRAKGTGWGRGKQEEERGRRGRKKPAAKEEGREKSAGCDRYDRGSSSYFQCWGFRAEEGDTNTGQHS